MCKIFTLIMFIFVLMSSADISILIREGDNSEGGSSTSAGRPPPMFECFYGCILVITRITHNTHKLDCNQHSMFYFLLSLQKHRVCVKHQNNLQTSKTIPRADRAPDICGWVFKQVISACFTISTTLCLCIWYFSLFV